jgi:hypothetical protein
MLPRERLDNLLQRWRTATPPSDDAVRARVWRRIHASPTPRRGWRAAWTALTRPALRLAFFGACAAALAAFVLLGLEMRRSRELAARNAELARRYVQWVDPQLVLAPAPATGGPEAFATELGWMRETLKLSPEQFARIQALHAQSSPQLRALAARVAQLREEFAAFEETRRTTGEVDFLEFAQFVSERRRVDRAWAESRRALVLATADAMAPAQREAYLALFHADASGLRPPRPPVN